MRKKQVDALLSHAKKDFEDIKVKYDKALLDKIISASLQIDVKNYLENLRSALDYTAHDIYEKTINPVREKNGDKVIKHIYFPYGKLQVDFHSSAQSSLPDLKSINSKLYSIIESFQPYSSGDDWICTFCEILNQKKHESLTPQVIEVENDLDIYFPSVCKISLGGGTISGSGTISSGQGTIILNNDTISGNSPAKNASHGVVQKIIKWEYFKFSDTGINVIPFLNKVLVSTEKIIDEVYPKLS